MTAVLAPYHGPGRADAHHSGFARRRAGGSGTHRGAPGATLAHLARTAFMSGMDLGLSAGAAVAAAGGLLALALMPSRPGAGPGTDGAGPTPAVTTPEPEPAPKSR